MKFNDDDENLDKQFNEIYASIIKKARLEKKYSLDDVVDKMNHIITKQSLYRYENNEARMKKSIFNEICKVLDLNPEILHDDINNRFIFLFDKNFDNATPIDISSDIIQIPVYGTIKAGIPIESQEDIIDYIDIPRSWTKGNKKFFGLKISGDSMSPKYADGDIVIFEQNNDMEMYNGKDCAIMINGTESTFKKLLVNDNGIVLQPYNTAYDIMMYSKEQVEQLPIKVIGIAREKRTKL